MTEIEIVHDPKMAMGGLTLSEDHELWPDGDWIRYARRLTGIKDLFVYRHRREETWVLCKWLWKPSESTTPTCLELATMNLAPDMAGSGRLVGSALLRSGFRAVGATAALAQYHSRAVLRIWLMEPASTIRQRYCTP